MKQRSIYKIISSITLTISIISQLNINAAPIHWTGTSGTVPYSATDEYFIDTGDSITLTGNLFVEGKLTVSPGASITVPGGRVLYIGIGGGTTTNYYLDLQGTVSLDAGFLVLGKKSGPTNAAGRITLTDSDALIDVYNGGVIQSGFGSGEIELVTSGAKIKTGTTGNGSLYNGQSGNSTIDLAAGTELQIDSGTFVNGQLSSTATIRMAAGSVIDLTGGSQVENQVGGEIIQDGGTFNARASYGDSGYFRNYSSLPNSIKINAGTFTVSNDSPFNNGFGSTHGNITIDGGTLILNSNRSNNGSSGAIPSKIILNSGTIEVPDNHYNGGLSGGSGGAGGLFEINGGTLEISNPGGSIYFLNGDDATGQIDINNGGTLLINGNLLNQGADPITGIINVNNGGTLTVNSDQLFNGFRVGTETGRINVAAGGLIEVVGGIFTNYNDCEIVMTGGTFNVSGGAFRNYSSHTNALVLNNATVNVTNDQQFTNGIETNRGFITINDGGLININSNNFRNGSTHASNQSKITINSGGKLKAENNKTFYNGATTNSTGNPSINGGAGGLIEINSGGILELPTSESAFMYNGYRAPGNIDINSGGQLLLYDGDIQNGSTILSGGIGTININGSGTLTHTNGNLLNGTSTAVGNLNIATGGLLDLTVSSVFENGTNGKIIMSGGTTNINNPSGKFLNYSTQTNSLDINGGNFNILNDSRLNNGVDTNAGNITVGGGTLTVNSDNVQNGSSGGTQSKITINSGSLDLETGKTFYNGATKDSGGTPATGGAGGLIEIAGGTLNLAAGKEPTLHNAFTSTGEIIVSSGNLAQASGKIINGNTSYPGAIIVNGTGQIDTTLTATLENSTNGFFILDAGTVNVNAPSGKFLNFSSQPDPIKINGGTFNILNDAPFNNGVATVPANVIIDGGTLTLQSDNAQNGSSGGTQAKIILNSGNLTFENAKNFYNGATKDAYGTNATGGAGGLIDVYGGTLSLPSGEEAILHNASTSTGDIYIHAGNLAQASGKIINGNASYPGAIIIDGTGQIDTTLTATLENSTNGFFILDAGTVNVNAPSGKFLNFSSQPDPIKINGGTFNVLNDAPFNNGVATVPANITIDGGTLTLQSDNAQNGSSGGTQAKIILNSGNLTFENAKNFYNGATKDAYGTSATGGAGGLIDIYGGTLSLPSGEEAILHNASTSTGDIYIHAGNLAQASGKIINGSASYPGAIIVDGTGQIDTTLTATLENSTNGFFILETGTVNVTAPSGKFLNFSTQNNPIKINGGNFNVLNDAPFNNGVGTNPANIIVDGGTLKFETQNAENGSSGSTEAKIILNNGKIDLSGSGKYLYNGATKDAYGTPAGNGAGGLIEINGGTLELLTGQNPTLLNGHIATGSIAINSSGTILMNSGLLFNGSNSDSNGHGIININNNGVITQNTGSFLNGQTPSTGTINIYDGGTGGTINVNNDSIFSNLINGQMNLNGGNVNANAPSGRLRNGGTINVNNGNLNAINNSGFNNGIETFPGTITVAGGNLIFESDNAENGSTHASNQSTITLNSGSIKFRDGKSFYNGATKDGSGNPVSGGAGGLIDINGGTFELTANEDPKLYNGHRSPGVITVNNASIDHNDGEFYNGTGASTGTLTLETGGQLIPTADAYFENGTNGQINVDGGTINANNGLFRFGGNISNGPTNSGNFQITTDMIINGATFTNGPAVASCTFHGADLSGQPTPIATGVMTIPAGQTFNPQNVTIYFELGELINEGTITNEGDLIIGINGLFETQGDFENLGAYINYHEASAEIVDGYTSEIVDRLTIEIPPYQILNIIGKMVNLSPNTLLTDGEIHNYGEIINGGVTPGTITINYGGKFYQLSGKITNGNVDSQINIMPGGALYNYYGDVDFETGGADSLEIHTGAKYHNIAGNNKTGFTLNEGSEFKYAKEINLDRNLALEYTWTITQNAIIKGNGHKIKFLTDEAGIELIGPDAELTLQDIIIEDIAAHQIRCTLDTQTITLDNVELFQDDTYTFSKGKLDIIGDTFIHGDNTTNFEYFSATISTINQNAKLTIYNTLEYTSELANRIDMINETSIIELKHGTLLATEPLTLANGTLITTGNSTLNGQSTLDLSGLAEIRTNNAPITIGTITT